MRKSITSGLVAVAALGSMGLFNPTAVAATGPAEAEAAPMASCVQVVRWYTQKWDKKVEVKNSCGYKVCFTVTVAARKDPAFSIGANRQESFRYGGSLWTTGTGIKVIGC